MAANTKFKKEELVNQLRHVGRKIQYPKNVDIDFKKSSLNYSLSPERDMSEYAYLKERLSQLEYKRDRNDIVYMSGWVITLPKELDEAWERKFFQACYNFLKARYGGEKNVISASVHKDEAGQPHMHFLFTPTVYEKVKVDERAKRVARLFEENPHLNNVQAGKMLGLNRSTVSRIRKKLREGKIFSEEKTIERLSAYKVLNPADFRTFHTDLQKYLDKQGIPCKVTSGITKKQGGNKTVAQLKAESHAHILEY